MTAERTKSTRAASRRLPTGAAGEQPVALTNIRALLTGLDRRQRQAVTFGDGPVLVVAGPGTGKTEVITRRIAWLIAGRRARPSEILALTFTDRAADEMQARVDVLVPYGQADTAIHTFHAFGDRLLREHGFEIGRPVDARVIGRAQAVALVREHIFELGLGRYLPLGDPTRFAGALVDFFGRAKEEGISPETLAAYAEELGTGCTAVDPGPDDGPAHAALAGLRDEAASQAELARAYAAYQELLVRRGLIDHADQVSEAVRLLEERPAIRSALRRHFRYIVVDEAQDANPQQLRMVRQLAGADGAVMFVGDDDQAIYSFRGAVGEGLSGLDQQYRAMASIVLRRNYRSRAPILGAARRLIRYNDPHRLECSHGLDKTLTAVRRSRRAGVVTHRAFRTSAEEADWVARHIRERIGDGATPGSIAVLVRSNADASPVLASLDVLGVPHSFSGASGLLGHREVRDVLGLLRTFVEPDSSADLYAVLTSRPYGLHGEDLTNICQLATRRRRSLWSIVTELLDQPGLLRLRAATRRRLGVAVEQLRASIEAAHDRAAPAVLYEHLRASGWLAALIADAERGDEGPIRRVARLFEIVKEQAELLDDDRAAMVVPALGALLDAGQDPVAPDDGTGAAKVAVLTVHQSKGLEFETVYVLGLAEGRFPLRGRREALTLPLALVDRGSSLEADRYRAEERRLLYVALTRARDELILTHATGGDRGGRRRRPSSFLAEALGREPEDPAAIDPAPGIDGPVQRTELARPLARASVDTGPLTLSFTQIDDYLTCPAKYRLRHEVRVPTPPHHALVLGNALHQAVASVNLARLRGTPVDLDAAQATFEAHWQSEGFLSDAHERARFASGVGALRLFLQREPDEGHDEVVAVERPFSVRIGPDRVRGRFDAIRDTPVGTVITDYKSGDVRDPERARQRARDSLQLQVYALAYEAETGERPGATELHFLEGDVIGRVSPTDRQLERAQSKIERAAAGIRAGAFDATPGYPACDWCPYRRICPAAS